MLQTSVNTSSVVSLPPQDNPGSPTEEMSIVSFLGLLGLMPVTRKRPVSVSHPKKKIPSEPTFSLSEIVAARKLTVARPIPCTHCDKTFGTHQNLSQHLLAHFRKKPYSCTECQKLFTTGLSLREHQKTFHRLNTYCCPYCEKNFLKLSRCKEHLVTHSRADPFQCLYCPMVFKQFIDLSAHIQLRHAQVSPEAIHDTEKRAKKCFPCPHCQKEFSRSYLLKVHLRTHPEKKPHKRSCCDKSRNQTGNLNVHEMSRTAEKNHTSIRAQRMQLVNPNQDTIFVCPNSQAEFTDYAKFVAHDIFHNKSSTLDCPDQQTKSEADVKDLLTSPCKEISSAHRLSYESLRHDSEQQQARSDTFLYYCPECGAPYSQLRTLKRHLKEYHQKEPKDIEIQAITAVRIENNGIR